MAEQAKWKGLVENTGTDCGYILRIDFADKFCG